MSETAWLVRELRDDLPKVVTLEWDDDGVRWVAVEQDWSDHVGSAELIRQTVEAYRAARPGTGNWRREISLGGIPVEQIGEFGNLVREARESDQGADREPIVVRTRHLESVWSPEGALVQLKDPRCWLVEAPRQAIAEELTAVLQAPDPKQQQTREVRRLLDFIEKVTTK